jgi:hypothetical protein
MKFVKQIGEFQAKSDSGELYNIVEFQEYNRILTGIGTVTETEGLEKWETSTGQLLKPIDSQTYQIIATNEIIHKI